MNINLTLFGQMLTFAIFVWFTMKFIWPSLTTAMTERENKIIEGLQAAEKGQQKLQLAEQFAKRKEAETKQHCVVMINEAKRKAEQIIEEAIAQAKVKKEEIIAAGNIEVEQYKLKIVEELKAHLAKLIVIGAEKIIAKHLDPKEHQHILVEISNKIYGNK